MDKYLNKNSAQGNVKTTGKTCNEANELEKKQDQKSTVEKKKNIKSRSKKIIKTE